VESQVEEIKSKLDIIDVINRYLPLKKRGKHFVACCPFHSEKTPSFVVSPELQIYKCFGCGKGGDVINFVQEFERIDFKEALHDLAKIAGVDLVYSQELSQTEHHRARLLIINHEVARFYHFLLLSHPLGKNALDYVLNRGITLDTIKLFQIGFSPVNPALISQYLQKKGFSIPDLIATGTFGLSQYHSQQLYDRFQGRLVFPLADARGRILGFSGRSLPGSTKTEAAKYINSPETDLYHKSHQLFGLSQSRDAIKSENAVIVTEGEFDMITPFQAGIKNIVAIKGTAFTPDQLQLLHRLAETLILALDSDFAGNNASKKSIELADSMGFDIRVVDLEDRFKDPDEALKADPDFFRRQIASALPIWDFLIKSAVKQNNPDTVIGKKKILLETLPFINKISNLVIRSDYLQKLADIIGSTPESVILESQKYQVATTAPAVGDSAPITPIALSAYDKNLEALEAYLIALVLSSKNPPKLSQKINNKYQFTLPRFQNLFSLLSDTTDFVSADFQQSLPPELVPIFQDIYLQSNSIDLDSHHRHLEISKVIDHLLVITIKEQLNSISRQIAQFEAQGQTAEIEKLELEYNQLLSRLPRLPKVRS